MLTIKTRDAVALACDIAAEIRPMLAEQPAWVHGAVLARLLGDFLADNIVEHDCVATELKRIALLQALLDAAGELVWAHDNGMVGHA